MMTHSALLVLAATAAVAHAQSFRILTPPTPDAEDWRAYGVSADGRYVAGIVFEATGTRAVIWSADGQPHVLPSNGGFNSANAVSLNPLVAAGRADSQAVIWTGGTDVVLGDGSANDITPDGSTAAALTSAAARCCSASTTRASSPARPSRSWATPSTSPAPRSRSSRFRPEGTSAWRNRPQKAKAGQPLNVTL